MDKSSIQTKKEQILHGLRLLNALDNGELFTSKFYYYLSYLDWLQSEKRVKVVHWSSLFQSSDWLIELA